MNGRLLATAAAAALAACGGLDHVDVTRSTQATVPAGPPGTPMVSGSVPLQVAIGDALAGTGVKASEIDSAKLRALKVEVISGSSFETWLESVAFYVEAPGLPRVLVAQRAGARALPAETRAVDLDTTDFNLEPYLLAPAATVTADASGTLPAVETIVRTTATLRVDVNVTGLLR